MAAPRLAPVLLSLGVLSLIAGPSSNALAQQWQWPEKGENLKVLPENTDARQLRNTMIGFVNALGVRCSHCHDGDGNDLSTYDFASDTREPKDKARVMMEMVEAINGTHLPRLSVPEDERLQVTCTTCHHGVTKPQPLEDLLAEILPSHGLEATIARYNELREQYYGGFAYDFGERTLINFAEALIAQQQAEEAVQILQLNAGHYPESAPTYYAMGEAYVALDDREAAIAQFEKALELLPDNPQIRRRLDEVRNQ